MIFPAVFGRIITVGLGLIRCHSKRNEQCKCCARLFFFNKAGCLIGLESIVL